MATATHRTYCRNCQSACGLLIETDDDRIVNVTPDRAHPITKGYMCVKGAMSGDLHNGEGRLLAPRKRVSEGAFSRIDPEQAMDEIAEKIQGIIDRDGPESVGLYFGTGVKFNTLGVMALRSWLRSIGSPNLYSSSTIDQSAKWVTASRMGMFLPGKHVIDDLDLMCLVGSNPPVSHQGLPFAPFASFRPQNAIRAAKARGMKLIVIDPRRTEIAREADLHLQIRPGEDVSLLAGVIHVILARGWEDRVFCDRFATSIDALKEAVAEFTPDYAADRAGIEREALIQAAEMFAKARRPGASSGTGPNMSPHSNLAEHLVEALNVLRGGYRRAGDKIRNVGSFSPRGEVSEAVRPPFRSWEQGPRLKTQDSGAILGEFPTSRLPDEILHGKLRALIVVGGNLATALAQPDKTVAALSSLELLVTLDPRMTETSRLSHYALPTKLPYERFDATHLFDSFFIETFAQVSQPVVNAPAEVLEDWEVFWGLARRMTMQLTLAEYKWGGGGSPANDIILDMTVKPTSEALMRQVCARGRIPAGDLFTHPEGVLSAVEPIVVQAAKGDDGARLDLCPPDVGQELETVRREQTTNPDYPFRLTVRRMRETMNSAFRDTEVTRRRWPQHPAFMHPLDMQALALAEGDGVEITSDAGSIVACAQEDPTLRRNVISMPHQWGAIGQGADPDSAFGSSTARLISLDRDVTSINFMPRMSAIPVRLRAATRKA